MARGFGLTALVIAILAGIGFAAWASQDRGSAAGPAVRVIIPGVASDSVPVYTAARQVVVFVELDVLELALAGSGVTTVSISAGANGPLPGQFDPPVTVSGTVTITTHPADVCIWTPIIDNPNFEMTYSHPPGSAFDLPINFEGPEWHYSVQCPGSPPPPPIRVPEGDVNESLTGWLGLIFGGGPGGAVIDTPPVSGGQDCVRRAGLVSNTNQFGAGAIHVWVTRPPCLIAVE